jgi:hypothetical protein
MYGSAKNVAQQPAPPPRQSPGAASSGRHASATRATEANPTLPIVIAAAILLYVVYAMVEQHEKLKAAIRPASIGLNVRNILVMLATVLLGIPLAKVAAVKLNALTGGKFGTRLVVQWVGLA